MACLLIILVVVILVVLLAVSTIAAVERSELMTRFFRKLKLRI
jgi:hypothetical protein